MLPGEPRATDDCFVETFDGSLRDECLSVHWFETIDEAKAKIEARRVEYDESRPHPETTMRIHHFTIPANDPGRVARVLAAFAREGWTAERVHNGPPHAGFSLVRGWIENHTCIEIGSSAMREQYERVFRELVAESRPPRP